MVDSYEVDASEYLVKPIHHEKMSAVMDKICQFYKFQTYSVHPHSNIMHIPINKIVYLDGDNNKCILHQKDGKCHTIYKSRMKSRKNYLPIFYGTIKAIW